MGGEGGKSRQQINNILFKTNSFLTNKFLKIIHDNVHGNKASKCLISQIIHHYSTPKNCNGKITQ